MPMEVYRMIHSSVSHGKLFSQFPACDVLLILVQGADIWTSGLWYLFQNKQATQGEQNCPSFGTVAGAEGGDNLSGILGK